MNAFLRQNEHWRFKSKAVQGSRWTLQEWSVPVVFQEVQDLIASRDQSEAAYGLIVMVRIKSVRWFLQICFGANACVLIFVVFGLRNLLLFFCLPNLALPADIG